MNIMHRIFGQACENCPICSYARDNPDGVLYKLMDSPIHGSWCPAWQGYRKLEEEGKLRKQSEGV